MNLLNCAGAAGAAEAAGAAGAAGAGPGVGALAALNACNARSNLIAARPAVMALVVKATGAADALAAPSPVIAWTLDVDWQFFFSCSRK